MATETAKKSRKHTDVQDKEATRFLIKETAASLLDAIQPDGLTLAGGGFLALSNENYQSVMARLTSKLAAANHNPARKLLGSEVLLTAERIERQCAGAGVLFARTFLQTLVDADKADNGAVAVDHVKIGKIFEKLRAGLVRDYVRLPKVINQRTCRFIGSSGNNHRQTISPAWHALNLAGLLGVVGVEKYKDSFGGSETIIERHSGHRFRLDMMRTFVASLSLGEFGTWDQKEVRILIVDGVLNSVAEIDKILLGSSKDKQPTLIVASYFEEEVVATVAANNIAGRTNVFLGLLPRDSLDGVNMANDIAVCCLSNPINTHSGHGVLSFLEFESLAVVDRVQINPVSNTLTITNPAAHGAVETQIRVLQEKLSELAKVGDDDKVREASSELLNKRISNLISDKVVIKVPSSKANVLIPALDSQLRLARSLLLHGQLKNTNKEFYKWLTDVCAGDSLIKLAAKCLVGELRRLGDGGTVVVGLAPYIVLWFASSLARQYLDTECMVLVSRSGSETVLSG
jgi:hypothetical protein